MAIKAFAIELQEEKVDDIKETYELKTDAEVRLFLEDFTIIALKFFYPKFKELP